MKLCVTEYNCKHPKYVQNKAFAKFRLIRAEIRFKAKTIVRSLPCDIYSDRPKYNIVNNNYSRKWRWLVVDIFSEVNFPPLATDTEVNNNIVLVHTKTVR